MRTSRRIIRSFHHAFSGLGRVMRYEQNFRIHILVAVFVATLALLLGFSLIEWAVLLITVGVVLTFEIFNSVVEDLIDILEPRIHIQVKIIKDGAAAAVLLTALIAIVIGAILFLPRLVGLFAP